MSGREPWADPGLRAAWAQQDWAAILREYRRAAGLSQRGLEAQIGVAQPYIAAIEKGRRRVTTPELKARIAEGLHVPPELTGAAKHTHDGWTPPAELQERIAHGHTVGRTDLRTADWIGEVLARHRRAEDEVGGQSLWPVVQSQLDAVTRLLPNTSGEAADRLLLLAAEHAHWLSWVAWAERQSGPALSWLGLAHGWAIDGGHADMASWVLRVRSYYTLQGGDPVRALRTAEAARAGSLSPGAASAAAHQTALAAAALGERTRARRLADEALALALEVPDEEDRPGWLYWLDGTRARLDAAAVAYACRDWAAAAEGIRAALPGLEKGYPRDYAHYAAQLADAERRA
ncbi:helix-turn-helix transcriptional regulator [Streptomyces sp. P9(2023)]|uniref:helix-turn-helix domain-containing protein n=1 Tax=Streptomyces sp. P9(2023) TaxID=3064394 RepID=UPI0028F45E4D|nr:helix-turn-helix transcriptional regulator [Streptomyces sp. P9(2023)]MDT9688207.1 helix-turn-helix transcriptional regulator [Streptomyces sp. P9(2023)]